MFNTSHGIVRVHLHLKQEEAEGLGESILEKDLGLLVC
jgi:hypothetical protein